MSRTIFHANIDQVTWASDVIRMLLFRDTDAYSPNPDDVFLSAWSGGGGVEISVASYARQTLGTTARTVDNTNNWIKYGSANVAFGTLESGQNVGGYIIYKQVGGDDSTPGDDLILLREDGLIDVQLYSAALISAAMLTVFPLQAAVPNGAALDFGGGATGIVNGLHAAGSRQIALAGGGLAAAAAADAIDSGVATTSPLPVTLLDGGFTVNTPTNGWFRKRAAK